MAVGVRLCRVAVCVLVVWWLSEAVLVRAAEPEVVVEEENKRAVPQAQVGRQPESEGEAQGTEAQREEEGQDEKQTEGEKADKAVKPARPKDLGFLHAFAASISVIIVSELGDKTFFIAAILAMKSSRCLVFAGALSALGLMTFLSVCLGFASLVIPHDVTFYGCTALLALFGLKMLYEGYKMSPDEAMEEFEEVSEELRKREEQSTQSSSPDPESLTTTPPLRRRLKFFGPLVSPIFLQAFSLTFLAEWGDRSQITTIILAARENALGVCLGGTLGHALCTALAVIGGKMIAQRISVKTVTIIGGVVFVIFALTAFLHNPDEEY